MGNFAASFFSVLTGRTRAPLLPIPADFDRDYIAPDRQWEPDVPQCNSIEELMRAPLFLRAFETTETIPINPDRPYRTLDRTGRIGETLEYAATRDEQRVYFAALKLDHMIRRCLYMEVHRANFDGTILCAIKAFLRHLDRTLVEKDIRRNLRLPSLAWRAISERMAFCRAIVTVCDRICHEENVPEFIPEHFENVILQHGANMDEAVYGNPFWVRYNGGGIGSDGRSQLRAFNQASDAMRRYQSVMERYWA